MGNIAFIFAGQGAQYVGMGKELYDNYLEVKQLFEQANTFLGFDIKKICFEGPDSELNMTENTQPAVFMMGVAAMKVLNLKGIFPQMTAGLSLGEYGALVAAGSISFEDGIKLVRKRAQLMQQAVPIGKGGMAAILGLDQGTILKCCALAADAGLIEPANYNCPGQIVLSGENAAIEKACEIAKELGAKRAVKLPVSAPFHSSMLKSAADGLKKELENIDIKDANIPVISNVEAKPVFGAAHIRELLIKQITHPVRWQQGTDYMIKNGIDTFIELGPGKALNGFLKRIDKNVKGYNVEDIASLDNALKRMDIGYES